MPFKKGVPTPGAGRKGYEVEKDQLERMNKVLNGVIELSEQLLEKKKIEIDQKKILEIDFILKKLETLKPLALKFCDKFHANKNSLDLGNKDGQPLTINVIKYGMDKND